VLLGNGDGTFRAKSDFGTGFHPGSVAIADLNADGRPDLAVASLSSWTVSVLLGNGDGTFGAKTDFGTGGISYSVAIADLNADGRPDLVVVNALPGGTVSVLLGNGDGTFGATTDFDTYGRYPHSVAIADLNADGRPDLVVANFESGTVSVLLNRGSTVDVPRDLPEAQRVSAATPNPTRSGACVRLELPTRTSIRASVFDMAGRLVRRVADGSFEAGVHTLTWDGTSNSAGRVAPGLYFCRITLDGREFNRTIVMIP
jgi:hypothetical protein